MENHRRAIDRIHLKDISILYVEDDDVTRETLVDFLKWSFDKVYAARDGKEGLEMFKQYNADIVITDIRMPVMDGLEMTSELRKINPMTPVIVVTAFSEIGYVMRAMELEVDGYIQKPILHANLIKTIYRLAQCKIADKLLNASEKRLRDITSALDEGIYVLDKAGCLVFMNTAAEDMLGWKEQELLGRHMHKMIHYRKPDGSSCTEDDCPVNRTIKTGERYTIEEDLFTRKDGSIMPVRYITTPMMEEDNVTGCITAFRGITQLS